MKCPIEAGVEILVYNVLDSIFDSEDVSLVDINRIQKKSNPKLVTDGRVSDIAVFSTDFEYNNNVGQIFDFIEVEATDKKLSIKKIKEQIRTTKHFIYTNGLVWKYYRKGKTHAKWEISLDMSERESVNAEIVSISEEQPVGWENHGKAI